MKKMKALILALTLGLTVVGAATAVGCDKSEKDSSTSVDLGFLEKEENMESLSFDKKEVKLYQYENMKLECSAKGTTEKIVYTSSDSSVASVDENGNVTAKDKIGNVTITATAGEAVAYCVVKVEKSPYHPQIILNSTEYTVEEGATLEFNVTTEWNKAELSEGVEYAISLAENSQGASATVSMEGNMVKVVAGSAESIDMVVSATVRGLYTSQQFTVNVIPATLKIVPMGAAFVPTIGEYVATLSSTDLVGDMANSVPMSFVATKGAANLNAVDINWTVDGKAVALEGGNLVGKEVGSATLVGTVEYEGETATVKVVCNVLPPELTLNETMVLELQATNLTFTLQSELLGTLKSAEYFGETVSNRTRGNTIAFDADKFPKTASKLGKQEMVINTSLVRYTMPVEVYTMIINNADELDQMRHIANTGEMEYSIRFSNEQGVDVYRNAQHFDGYFILGNDIDYNKTITSMTDTGSVWQVQGSSADDRGFKGIFDGCGYNVDGVTVGNNPSGDKKQAGGIFGYIATGGIVRNVSFTNAVLETNQGFICTRGNGTVENVSVSYKKIGGNMATSLNTSTPNMMGTFFSAAAGNKATVKNCLVDASAADIALEFGEYNGLETMNVCLVGKAINVNVIALCPDTRVLEKSGADIQRLTYNDLVAESELMESFDKDYWTTVDGIPMFINQAEMLDRDVPVDFLNVKESLVAGFSMLVLANNPYTRIEVQPVEGVSFENSMLSATEEAFTKTVTLKVVSLFNAENAKTIEVYIDSFGTNVEAPTDQTAVVYYNNPVLTIGENSWMGEENYVYVGADIYSVGNGAGSIVVDWKKFGWDKQTATVVMVKQGVRTHFYVDMQIGYPVSDFKDSVKVQDSAFSAWRGKEYILTEVTSDIAAPEGYENIARLDGDKDWSTALDRGFFNGTDLSAYKEIWFGMKIVNGGWVILATDVQKIVTGWVFFHYIQVEEGVWVAEIINGAQHYKTVFDVVGTNLQQLTYRDGWGNGFLLYNNNGRRPVGETTHVYATEIRGILK